MREDKILAQEFMDTKLTELEKVRKGENEGMGQPSILQDVGNRLYQSFRDWT